MSLLGIAIIGKSNEPLYLCDCEQEFSAIDSPATDSSTEESPDDAFGFIAAARASGQGHSLPIHRQILLHAALDSLDEMTYTHSATGQMPILKHPTKQVPHWVGLVREVEEVPVTQGAAHKTCVYAYVTATNIKFLALTQGTITAATDVRAMQTLLKELHQHYSMYISNPFCNTRGPIVSSQFDAQVTLSIKKIKQPTVVVD